MTEGITIALLLGIAAVGGWLVVRLVVRAEREARERERRQNVVSLARSGPLRRGPTAGRAAVGAIDEDRDDVPEEELGEAALAEHFAEDLLSLPLVVPPPSVGGATNWLMNQGPVQFGLMPDPHAVQRLVVQLETVLKTRETAARERIVAAVVEVLLRSIEWRYAEEVHHLLIYILGELGDEHTLPVLDGLAVERAFDQEEKKALFRARGRVQERLDARRGRLAMTHEGGELAFAPSQDP